MVAGRHSVRIDLHNASVHLVLAEAGCCGMIHLPTGRVCTRRTHHAGTCDFRSRDEALSLLAVENSGELAPRQCLESGAA